MIVVDTNIIAYATFRSDHTASVLALHEYDPEWEAPFLWRSEYMNVVSLYLRKKLINIDKAVEAVDAASNFIAKREHITSPYALLEWMNKSSCSSYDCEFIALAEKLRTRLITYDKQILTEFPAIAMKPEDYLAQVK